MTWNKNSPFELITDRTKLRNRALYWLSKRDYSQYDFRKKLDKVCEDEILKEDLIADFIQKDWLNEQRYVLSVVKTKVRAGFGLNRINNDLRQHGIRAEQVQECVDELDIDWFENAKSTYVKKYGEVPAGDFKERGKRYRFLQARGYDSDQVKYAMSDNDSTW